MNLDEELRATLLARAEEAPSGVGALEAARARAHRLAQRRRIGVAGVAAVVGVAAAIGVPYALAPGPGSGGVGIGLPTTPPASPTMRPSTVELAAPAYAPAAFPFTPGYTPPGLGQPTVGRTQGQTRLVYEGEPAFLIATVSAEAPFGTFDPTRTQAVTVGSRPATLTTGNGENGLGVARIVWQLADQRWVDVTAGAPVTPQQLRQYADHLQPPAFTPPAMPFTLALAPQGFQVAFQEINQFEFHFCLAPSTEVDGDTETWVCVSHNQPSEPHPGDPVPVGPDPGEVTHNDGLTTLYVHRPGFEFLVTAKDDGPLNLADLVRFAAGVAKS